MEKILEISNENSAKAIKYLQKSTAPRCIYMLRMYPKGLSNDPVLFAALREFLKIPNIISNVRIDTSQSGLKTCEDFDAYIKLIVDTLSIFEGVSVEELHIWDPHVISAASNIEPLKHYFRTTTSFKKICPNFDRIIDFDLLQQLDLNQHVEKICLNLGAISDGNHDVISPTSTITKLGWFRIRDRFETNEIVRYIDMIASQPHLTKIALENFKLTPAIINSLMAIIQKGHLKKLKLINYSLSDGASEYLNDLSKIILASLTSVFDTGALSKYIFYNLDSTTTLTNLDLSGNINCYNFNIDEIIRELSKTNIVIFDCCRLATCAHPKFKFSFTDKLKIEESWNKILSDNYSLTKFNVSILDKETSKWFGLELNDLTNRNKNVLERFRFTKHLKTIPY